MSGGGGPGGIVYQGWLRKSPPERKMKRDRWHRRWFILRSNNGLSTLEYYKDDKSKTPIKVINLDDCDQVDEGLTFSAKPAFGFIFDLKTRDRKYFLVAESEEDMSRWVQQICNVCGFFSDQDNPEEVDAPEYSPSPDPGVPMLPVQTADPLLNLHPESQPMMPPQETNGRVQHDMVTPEVDSESYLKLWEPKLKENGDLQNGHTDFRERRSSFPDSPAPSPPNQIYSVPRKQPTYDVPPPAVSVNLPLYDIPQSRFMQDVQLMNDLEEDHSTGVYRNVPHRSTSVDVPSRNFEQQISLTNGCDDEDSPRSSFGLTLDDVDNNIYQVPPNNQLVLNNPLLGHLTNDDVTKSTDDLAQKFKLISQSNQARPSYSGSEHQNIYMNDMQKSPEAPPRPPKPPSLTTSDTNSSSNITSPARLQDDSVFYSTQSWYEPMVSNSPYKSPPIKAPPRPPKPDSIRNNHSGPATPPPSFEDSFGPSRQMGVSPRLLEGRLSETGVFDDLYAPMASNIRSSSLSFGAGSSLSDFIPTTQRKGSGDGYLNLRDDEKCSINSPLCPVNTGLYMPMQGTANPSPSFIQQSDTHYLPMQGSLDDSKDDFYKGLTEQPKVPPHSVPLPRHASVPSRLIPPPVDRSIKPNRIDGDSMGMHGSYYATDNEPRESRRTRSFHKQREHRLYNSSQDKLEVPIPDRHDSSSSNASSSDALTTPLSDHYLDSQEDTHVIVLPGLKGIGLPSCSSPDDTKHDVVYTELHHSNTPSNTQATPKKDLSSKVDYVDLDPEKTQALKNIIEDRESERPR